MLKTNVLTLALAFLGALSVAGCGGTDEADVVASNEGLRVRIEPLGSCSVLTCDQVELPGRLICSYGICSCYNPDRGLTVHCDGTETECSEECRPPPYYIQSPVLAAQ